MKNKWESADEDVSGRYNHSPKGERKKMPEEKKQKEKGLEPKVKSVKKVSVKEGKKEDQIDEKKLLKEAKDREREAKIEVKKEKKIKKEEKKIEKKEEKEEEKKIKRIKKRSKKYRSSKEKIKIDKIYEVDEAIKLIKDLPKTKFDPTVELHLRLDKKVENLRGVVNLPAGAPKSKKVLEVDDKNVDEIIEKVKSGKIEFDIMVASPLVMPRLASLAKILGPKGMMPNPKNGTISENVKEAAEDFRGGKIEFKADKGNNLHFALAKVLYSPDKIKENLEAVISAVPIGKVISAHLNATMGPSIRIKISK